MKVLITGSSGALGRLLTNHLTSRNVPVIGLGRQERPKHPPGSYFHYYSCSITDREKLQSIFNEERPTHVVHFACSFNKVRDRQKEYEIDIRGSKNILEICHGTPSVKSLIYSSSAAAYGGHPDNPPRLRESDPLRPGEYRYGLNKKTIEQLYFSAPVRSDLRITALRICTVVGPTYDKPRSVVSLLIKSPFLPGFCADNKIQFLHSEDFTELMGRILEDEEIQGVFNLANNDYAVIRELVPGKKFIGVPLQLVKGFLWVTWNLRLMNLQPAGVVDGLYPITLDPARIMDRYGYKFKYSTREAFDLTVQHNEIPAEAYF